MDKCKRVKSMVIENGLTQKQFADSIKVSQAFISKLIKDPDINMSPSLAALVEEKYGYRAEWILNGTEPKFKTEKNQKLTVVHHKVLMKLEELSDEQIKAVLAFIRFLEMDN